MKYAHSDVVSSILTLGLVLQYVGVSIRFWSPGRKKVQELTSVPKPAPNIEEYGLGHHWDSWSSVPEDLEKALEGYFEE